jgi:hypothetical protein
LLFDVLGWVNAREAKLRIFWTGFVKVVSDFRFAPLFLDLGVLDKLDFAISEADGVDDDCARLL